MEFDNLLRQCFLEKRGNKDFALFYFDDDEGTWAAEIGNSSRHVSLGEAPAEFRGEGKTMEQAVGALLTLIKAANKTQVAK